MTNSTRILVVDDEPIGRQLLEAILVPEGYDITFGNDGEEAVKVALNELPDIILLDVMMPKMDGFEVCKKLRENTSTAHIPIYLITALDDRDSRIRGIDAGAYDYISKPFDRIEILAKIKNLTNQIKILKKSASGKEEIPKVQQKSEFDSVLIRMLAQIILDSSFDPEKVKIYRSKAINESVHACIGKETKLGKYIVLISNKIKDRNSVIANCIFRSILFNSIETYDGHLKKIIHHGYQDLAKIVEKDSLTVLKHPEFSIIIIFHNNQNNEISVTGLNQHLYVLESNPLSDQDQNPDYNSYYLQGNQELKFDKIDGVLAFSPDVYDKINQKELLIILNDMLKESGQINLEKLVNDKLSITADLLIVKLSF